MAYIQNDKLLDDQQQQSGPQDQANMLLGGGASNDVGSGVSSAGVGAGGQGGWTNIQAYLNANKGDTGSAQALGKTVGSQFETEKKTMQDQSKGFLEGAQKQVSDAKIDNNKADELIKSAADSYSWGGEPSLGYKNTVGQVQGALTKDYSGPTSYSYGFGNQTQNYARDLKDNGGFDQLMNSVYSKAAGSPLTGGQYQLQKQLDVNNAGLGDMREKLLRDYSGLEGERDKTVQDTTSALGGLAEQYRNNQTALRDYLGRKQNDYDQAIAKAEADARAGYNRDFTTGLASAPEYSSFLTSGQAPFDRAAIASHLRDFYSPIENGQAGFNWQDVQNLLNNPTNIRGGSADDLYTNSRGELMDGSQVSGYFRGRENQWRQVADPALKNFYTEQDAKYGNTADPEERSFNAILDFLNSTGPRKEQGFKVRG